MGFFTNYFPSFNLVALMVIHLTRGEISSDVSGFPHPAKGSEPQTRVFPVTPSQQDELQTIDISRHVCQSSGTGDWICRSRYNNALYVRFGGTGTIPGAILCTHTPGLAGSGCVLCRRPF